MDLEGVKRFVLSRRAFDGGFAFCQPLPSSLPETYYAVYVLKTLGEKIDGKDELVRFLHSKLGSDVYSIFYVLKTLSLLGESLPDVSESLERRLEEAMGREQSDLSYEVGITATYSFENPNVLREVYMIVESLRLLGGDADVEDFVERFRRNGGYGVGRANLKDTFYAVSVVRRNGGVIDFVLEHECDEGGFAKHPHSYPPYLEDTYHALSIFEVLGYDYKSDKTVRYVESLQNPDGGFRRSIYLGISTLEDTFYAIASLKMLGEI